MIAIPVTIIIFIARYLMVDYIEEYWRRSGKTRTVKTLVPPGSVLEELIKTRGLKDDDESSAYKKALDIWRIEEIHRRYHKELTKFKWRVW